MPDERGERFTALYEETRARMVAYAMRRTASREDAADVVAETYTIAWRRLDDVPEGKASLLWLYVTARHVVMNHGRRLRRQDATRNRLANELHAVEPALEPHDEEAIVALFCLNSLPEDEREILMLTAWDGLSAPELGRVLNCSPTAARIRLYRARTHLNAEIAGFSEIPKHGDVKHGDVSRQGRDEDPAIAGVPEEG